MIANIIVHCVKDTQIDMHVVQICSCTLPFLSLALVLIIPPMACLFDQSDQLQLESILSRSFLDDRLSAKRDFLTSTRQNRAIDFEFFLSCTPFFSSSTFIRVKLACLCVCVCVFIIVLKNLMRSARTTNIHLFIPPFVAFLSLSLSFRMCACFK